MGRFIRSPPGWGDLGPGPCGLCWTASNTFCGPAMPGRTCRTGVPTTWGGATLVPANVPLSAFEDMMRVLTALDRGVAGRDPLPAAALGVMIALPDTDELGNLTAAEAQIAL